MGLLGFFVLLAEWSPSLRLSGARRRNISVPRIAFVNKLDRAGADFFHTVEMMRERLRGTAADSAVALR